MKEVSKYLGARVMKPFFDEDQDVIRDFGGDVISVDWHQRYVTCFKSRTIMTGHGVLGVEEIR